MSTQLHQLPVRGKGPEQQIEVRPIYVEEWLDTLPYIDFHNTSKLLHDALHASNKVPMKFTQRLELITLYNRPYQYYLDSQVKAGAQHTLQSIQTMQSQLESMKRLAVELARGSRLAVDEALNHKSLWGQNKFPLQAIVSAMIYISHALIFSFLEYAPTPKNVWQELNFLYQFAEGTNQHRTPVKLLNTSKKGISVSIEHVYKQIVLASLADPYHLPFGAIWEIYNQLDTWAEYAEVRSFVEVDDAAGYFVVCLNGDVHPVPYSKFEKSQVTDHHRLIDANKLRVIVQQQLGKIGSRTAQDEHFVLSPHYAKTLLEIMHKAWGLPAQRFFPRQAATGNLVITQGLNSSYFHINRRQDFTYQGQPDSDVTVNNARDNLDKTTRYTQEIWNLVDTSAGGVAVTRDGRPGNGVRVGDLVGFSPNGQGNPQSDWKIGSIRWLLIRQIKIYKAGIQTIANRAYPAAVRAITGSEADRDYRRAFLTGNPAKEKEFSIITSKGLYSAGRELEINFDDKPLKVSANKLIESTFGFDQFNCKTTHQ